MNSEVIEARETLNIYTYAVYNVDIINIINANNFFFLFFWKQQNRTCNLATSDNCIASFGLHSDFGLALGLKKTKSIPGLKERSQRE